MLKFFRNQKNSWLMKGILTLTALSFVSLFGLTRTIDGIPDEGKAIATVDGKKITVAEYVNEVFQQIKFISKITQKPFTMQDAVRTGLLPDRLNRMVSDSVTKRTLDGLKLTVSENDVRESVKRMPAFEGMDGSFSMAAYKKYLSETGTTEKRFIDDTFTAKRTEQLKKAVSALSTVSREMAETGYRIQNEKRAADVFTVTAASLKIAGKPTDEEKEELYKDMAEELTSPEYRSFTVMTLTLDDIAKKITLSEDELKEAFNENKADYTVEEIRDVDQMLFSTKEEADEAYAALQSGRKFTDVAEKIAHQTEDQTKLGDVTPSTATADWADIVFSAKKGEYTAPVQTAFGWQILRVNKITPKIEKSFKEVRDEIEQKLIASMAFDTLSETAVALDDRFGAGETIEDVAKSTNFPVKKYKLVDPSGLDENGKSVPVSKAVLATAFSQETGKESPMTEDGTGFFVLRVDDVRDPAVKPIEKAQKEIQAAWVAGKQREKAKEIAAEIENELNKGLPAKVVARKTGAAYKHLNGLTRRDATLPASVVYGLFNRPVGKPVVLPSAKEYIVARVSSVSAADPKKDPSGVEKLRLRMQNQTAEDKEEAFLNDFALLFKTKINQDAVMKAFSYLTKSVQENDEE